MKEIENLLYSPFVDTLILSFGGIFGIVLVLLRGKVLGFILKFLPKKDENESSSANNISNIDESLIRTYKEDRDFWKQEYDEIKVQAMKARKEMLDQEQLIDSINKKYTDLTQRTILLERLIVSQQQQLNKAQEIISILRGEKEI